jgi:alpha-tubulin suppressor-like RCC1 family protein
MDRGLMDRAVQCWDPNYAGQLGDGTTTEPTTPVEVSGITTATGIALCGSHSCALLIDGKARGCGQNGKGQLGSVSGRSQSSTPVDVYDITTATSIDLGCEHSCAVLSNGKVKCWGWNNNGLLDIGNTNDRTSPVEVSGISNATSIALGGSHSCALLTDGKMMCWDRNDYGKLGDGTTNTSTTPVSALGPVFL